MWPRVCQEEWDKLPKSRCEKSIETSSRRIRAVTTVRQTFTQFWNQRKNSSVFCTLIFNTVARKIDNNNNDFTVCTTRFIQKHCVKLLYSTFPLCSHMSALSVHGQVWGVSEHFGQKQRGLHHFQTRDGEGEKRPTASLCSLLSHCFPYWLLTVCIFP